MQKQRLWWIPVWLTAQFLWILLTSTSGDGGVGLRCASALSQMTSLNNLWITVVVLAAAIFYKSPTPKGEPHE